MSRPVCIEPRPLPRSRKGAWLARAFSAAILLGLLGGCEDRDPYHRTDVWYPSGVNAWNIAAMVANPADLISGHGVQRSDGKEAVTAVDRVWQDKPKPLPAVTGAGGGSSGSGSGSSSGSGAGTGG
jgi:hypothetical protein